MKKLLAFALGLFLWCAPALAQPVVPVQMRDANLTTTATQNLISTLNTFTAPRTLTIPGQGALSSYYLQFADTANAINGANTLTIRTADGSLINGGATLTLSLAGAYAFIVPSSSGYYASIVNSSGSIGTPGGTNGQIEYNQSGVFGGFTASGDATINTSTGAVTFTTVNANVGAFGSNVNCTTYTVNAKGLITAASQTACTPAVGSITGLGTGIATALAVNVGSAGAPVLFNGAGGTPSSLVGTNISGTALGLTAGTANAVAVTNVNGMGAGCNAWLVTPTSANLRTCLTDETGTGSAYFQGGDIGTPSAGNGSNLTSLNATNLASGTVSAARLSGIYFPPQGRLTLQTLTPVMTTTQSGKTTIFYTPYAGNVVPLYDGTNTVPTPIAEISVATTDTAKNPAAIGASKVNDWFIWNDVGTIRISHGPDWTNDTTRSAGTALIMVNGILLNNASITNACAAQRCTYVGTTRSNGSSQLDWIFGAAASGGTAGFHGVWNAYNRVNVVSNVIDNGASYTYTSATKRQARASVGNQITFVVGLQEDGLDAVYTDRIDTVAALGATGAFGVGYDSTAAYNSQQAVVNTTAAVSISGAPANASKVFPTIGVHFIAAVEGSDGTNANTFNSNSLATLSMSLRM